MYLLYQRSDIWPRSSHIYTIYLEVRIERIWQRWSGSSWQRDRTALYTRSRSRDILAASPGNSLTREQKRAFPRYLVFLMKKRCERIKARGCADGRKQLATTSKEEALAPTVAINSVMITSVVPALKKTWCCNPGYPSRFHTGWHGWSRTCKVRRQRSRKWWWNWIWNYTGSSSRTNMKSVNPVTSKTWILDQNSSHHNHSSHFTSY